MVKNLNKTHLKRTKILVKNSPKELNESRAKLYTGF